MRLVIIFIMQVFFIISLFPQQTNKEIKVFDFNSFEPFLHRKSDSLYLVNFWATWCAPCIKELPAIESIREKYKNHKFKIILVSLDFPKQLNSRLKPFVVNKNIQSEVILLDDPDQNRWIDKVDPAWSGEIPFTVIYSKNSRESFSRSFTFNELDSIINLKINQL